MADFTGTNSSTLVSRERQFVRGQGWVWTEVHRGGVDEINGLIPGYANTGWEVDAQIDQPYATLTATRQATNETNNQEFFDRFRFSYETVEKDIFAHPDVQEEINGVWVPTTGDNAAGYRDIIEQAVEDGSEELLPSQVTYPIAWKVYRELARGAEAYEDEYLVLTRERVVGILFSSDPMQLRASNTATIYTTAELQSVFNIPSIGGVTFPDSSSDYTPPDTKWGWRSRRHEVRFLEGQRAELVQDWAYAAWSTYLYSPYTP